MSRLAPHRLTARQVAAHKDGDLADGGNLWLVARGNSRIWTIRYTSPTNSKRREMSLGSAYDIGLAEARTLATDARRLVNQRIDPLEQRRTEDSARKQEAGLSFRAVADRYIESQTPGWRDPRAASIWSASLEQNVYGFFGDKPVAMVDTSDVESVLKPIWTEKTETATRIRGRIERILDYARAQGWRSGENPARWRGHLSAILAPPSKVAKVEHHAAIDRKDIARVMAALATSGGIAAKSVRFACLTAARSGEVRSATWGEIDLGAKVWTVPAHRMKTGKEHRVPLSDGAVAILQEVRPLRDERHGDLVFPGQRAGKPLSDVALSKALHIAAGTKDVTVHGLRSTFRDWAAEETDYPREVAEMALAHAISNKVEAAYRRGDLFEKRREMMGAWAESMTRQK
ncbi:phage integrase [Acetobacter nitrogenifigens DSM 23921 = NBRC 105050]|uniref:Bacteriophage P4 integrase n=1 Tax=Acetobacter nitrogenifigens DSM 23921 = NBRC 105050 TaxID=1120919 RepID=A0A511XD14_9PROT|nr:tyrosine-type recombinase/integrase [Acetobacter nitrogenifigens]GBQ91533.1 phage integrase [Acetobacter nitrogenifigens DSM 23921 = NBRC 105050]GEN60840.1 bacteriophage P4 integrase [Acetobacter nitrogenifigens DSM 23921 = NBRC 105050]